MLLAARVVPSFFNDLILYCLRNHRYTCRHTARTNGMVTILRFSRKPASMAMRPYNRSSDRQIPLPSVISFNFTYPSPIGISGSPHNQSPHPVSDYQFQAIRIIKVFQEAIRFGQSYFIHGYSNSRYLCFCL